MKNKKILLLTITLVISVSQIDAMGHLCQQVIVRNFGKRLTRDLPKEIAKKAFSKTMTGLHWYIAAGQMIKYAISEIKYNELFGVKLPFGTENVSKNVESFVQETLKDNNIKVNNFSENQPTKSCQIIATTMPAKTTSKRIILNPNQKHTTGLNNLDELIKRHRSLTEPGKKFSEPEKQELKKIDQELDSYRAMLLHEVKHINANDHYRWTVAACAIPLGTNYITRRIGQKVLPSATSNSGIGWFFRKLSKIPTGCVKQIINDLLFAAYMRHREQEADDNIPKNKAILQGGIRFLKHAKKISEKKLQKKVNSLSPDQQQYQQSLALIQRRLLGMHPLIEKRIKKLEERIENLES